MIQRPRGTIAHRVLKQALHPSGKIIIVLLAALATANLVKAEDAAFHRVKLADAKGMQTDATLVFSDSNKSVVVRVADRDFVTIPYEKIDKCSYEYTKKHRITQGAIVMVASLGAGAIVMLTKSKSHWLYIDYHEEDSAKSVVLRMDKREYKDIIDATKIHTGKEVQFLGNVSGKQKEEKEEQKGKS